MVKKILAAMLLSSADALAPGATWAHATGRSHHHRHHHHHHHHHHHD